MDISFLLISSAISLVGLHMCLPSSEVEKMTERYWAQSRLLRVIYGLFQLVGVVFVLVVMGYLTFKVHWWYILVYIGGVFAAKFIALLLQFFFHSLFSRRIAGTILIIISIVCFLAGI